jgi:hypothetical protein
VGVEWLYTSLTSNKVMVVIIWLLDLQLPMQSMPSLLTLRVQILLRLGVLDATDRHDIAEILLKVVLKTILSLT